MHFGGKIGELIFVNSNRCGQHTCKRAEQVKYNSATGKFVYVTTETDNNVVLFDWKNKTQAIILDGTKMIEKF